MLNRTLNILCIALYVCYVAVLLMYQEAFLSTYRTFISTSSLIDKLLYRYNKFSKSSDAKKKKLSRNAFSLLIRVTDELWFVSLSVNVHDLRHMLNLYCIIFGYTI